MILFKAQHLPECSRPLRLQPGKTPFLGYKGLHLVAEPGPGGNRFHGKRSACSLLLQGSSLLGVMHLLPRLDPGRMLISQASLPIPPGSQQLAPKPRKGPDCIPGQLHLHRRPFPSGFPTKGFAFRKGLSSLPLFSPRTPCTPPSLCPSWSHIVLLLMSSPANLKVPEWLT